MLTESKNSWFTQVAKLTARKAGQPGTFVMAVLIILIWAVSGPIFGFSDTWQLIINTGTTIITFLMVFLIQNTQNRDTEALQMKLDELIRVLHGARNELIDLEDQGEQALERRRREFERLAHAALHNSQTITQQ